MFGRNKINKKEAGIGPTFFKKNLKSGHDCKKRIEIGLTGKEWPLGVELARDAADGPDINWRTVIG